MTRHLPSLTLAATLLLGAGLAGASGLRPAVAHAAGSASLTVSMGTSPVSPAMKQCDPADGCGPDPAPSPHPSPPPVSKPAPAPSPTPSPAANGGLPNPGITAITPSPSSAPPGVGNTVLNVPLLQTTTSSVSPGGTVTVSGSNLGTAKGMLQLEGNFPGAGNAPGGVATLQVSSWTDTRVVATLPAGLRGVPDQTAQVLLITADTRFSNTLDITFTAARETIPCLCATLRW